MRRSLQHGFEAEARCGVPESRSARDRLRATCSANLTDTWRRFEEVRAQATLDKMRELRRRFPVHLPAADLQRCEEQIDRLRRRAGAVPAADRRVGCAGGAPQLAPATRRRHRGWCGACRPSIRCYPCSCRRPSSRRCGRRSCMGRRTMKARKLLASYGRRQREVVAKVKNLAGIIHRFHELSQRLSPDDNALRRAEANYRARSGGDSRPGYELAHERGAGTRSADGRPGRSHGADAEPVGLLYRQRAYGAQSPCAWRSGAHQRSKPGPTPRPAAGASGRGVAAPPA